MVNKPARVPPNPLKTLKPSRSAMCRPPRAFSVTITVSLQTYKCDSNSVLQEIPTSHALPIVGQYDPG
jgi:hypothetical protein